MERDEVAMPGTLLALAIPLLPEPLRADAAYWSELMSDVLLYGSPSPERWVSMVPASFHSKDHYQILVEQTIAEMPEGVKAEIPGRLAMARTIAAEVDNSEYCLEFRIDVLNALEEVMIGLQRQDADEVEEVES
jgi:hypothetical protein